MANVVLGLFSPFKYELPEYMHYDISKLRDNVRFLEVLVNRGGSPGGLVALYFDGAVNYFKELPRPENLAELNKIYDLIGKEAFKPSPMTSEELAEEAYLKAEYNSILLEMMMEE